MPSEWPRFTPHGGAEDDAISAILVLRAHAARNGNGSLGLFSATCRGLCKRLLRWLGKKCLTFGSELHGAIHSFIEVLAADRVKVS